LTLVFSFLIIKLKKVIKLPLICEINDISFKFSLEIISSKEEIELSLADILRKITVYSTKFTNLYDEIINKRGKIFGQERILIIENIDQLFIMSVLFLFKLLGMIKNDINILDFKVPITFSQNKFISSGSILKEDMNSVDKINVFFENNILFKIKEILVYYKKIFEVENKMDIFMKLLNNIDDILYNIIILRHNIKNCIVDI